MNECYLCPRNCGVDRENTKGFCGRKNKISLARSALHFWEEPPLSGTRGSGAVFFTGCSLRCSFCQNYDISLGENSGKEVTPKELNRIFFSLIEQGAHNINLVTPTHFVDKIGEALSIEKLPVPVIYNCGGYENVSTLKNLEGLIDIYLPDFKYSESGLAEKLSRAADYLETAIKAITEMVRQQPENICDDSGIMQKGVIIRHLILPLHTQNSIKALNIIADKFRGVSVSLMAQYTPVKENSLPELNRKITARELKKVQDEMLRLGIDGFVQAIKSAEKDFIPDFHQFG